MNVSVDTLDLIKKNIMYIIVIKSIPRISDALV